MNSCDYCSRTQEQLEDTYNYLVEDNEDSRYLYCDECIREKRIEASECMADFIRGK